jgi:hypothetical protein
MPRHIQKDTINLTRILILRENHFPRILILAAIDINDPDRELQITNKINPKITVSKYETQPDQSHDLNLVGVPIDRLDFGSHEIIDRLVVLQKRFV